MSKTEDLSITLPTEIVVRLRERVAAGEFHDVSEAVHQSLLVFVPGSGQPLGMSKEDFEKLLQTEVLPVYEAMRSDPSRGLSMEEVRANLASEIAEFQRAS